MKCKTKNCRGAAMKSGKSPYCSKCRSRRWKDKFPLHYSFHLLRGRARERGKDFSLTLDQYISFAIKTDYARMKGKTSLSLSIDRIDNDHGYHHWNIRAITLAENSRKLHSNIPGWMKEEIRMCKAGHISESHRNL